MRQVELMGLDLLTMEPIPTRDCQQTHSDAQFYHLLGKQ
jgi:hypothetical protein